MDEAQAMVVEYISSGDASQPQPFSAVTEWTRGAAAYPCNGGHQGVPLVSAQFIADSLVLIAKFIFAPPTTPKSTWELNKLLYSLNIISFELVGKHKIPSKSSIGVKRPITLYNGRHFWQPCWSLRASRTTKQRLEGDGG